MDKDLQKILENLGLTEKEASVYLALLELSQGTVTQISRLTNLKRPIIYVILERLIKQGYVSEIPNKKINKYQALDPSIILNQTKVSVKNFVEMLPILQTLHNKGKKRPKIHYIEAKDGILKIYEEMLYAQDAIFISSYERIEKQFPNAIDNWIKKFEKGITKLKGRHLIIDNPTEREIARKLKKIGQQVKILSGAKKLNMDFTLYDNKLTLTFLEDEPFMVLIESQELVDSMRPIFEIAWRSGKELRL